MTIIDEDKPFPSDSTRLGDDLQKLEKSSPKVKAARAEFEIRRSDMMDRLRNPDDYVNPDNLQVTDADRRAANKES